MPTKRSVWICACLIYILAVCLNSPRCAAVDSLEEEEEEGGEDKKGTRPRGLIAEVLNSTTISLTWKHPKIVTADCPVKRYVLRLKQDGARRSRAWKVDGARRALGLHNLKPETLYSIRMVAITCAGKGKPSKWVEVTTTDLTRRDKDRKAGGNTDTRQPREEPSGIETRPPGRPTNVRTRTFPDSVILNWENPTDTEIMVRGYMVGYGEGVPDVNWQYVAADQRNVTIKNLKHSTQYIISLRALNNQGRGPAVYDMIHTRGIVAGSTMPPTTIQRPENLRAKVLSASNVWLQWRDPSLDQSQQITDSRYYNVHYQALPDGEKLSVVVKALHVVLYELTPGTTYEFKVRTVKDSYYSDFSESISNTTSDKAPGSSPRSVTVTPALDSSGVVVQWRPPKQPNGKVIGYLVLHSNDRVKPIAMWNAMATADTSAIVNNLEPGQTYYFKVKSENSKGYGPLSKTTAFTVPLGTGNGIGQGHSGMQALLPDISTDKLNHNVTEQGSESMYMASGNMSQSMSNMTESSENNELNQPSKNKRHDSFDTPSMAAQQQVAPSKSIKSEVHFSAKVLHTISAFITWPSTPPNCNCDVTDIQYVFHLYMRGKEETPEMRHLDSNVMHLEDLDPNERYHYQIKYIFPNGTETAWSQEQALDTDCHGAGK